MPATRPPADKVVQQFPKAVIARASKDPVAAALLVLAKAQAAQAASNDDFTRALNRAVDTLEPGMKTLHAFGERLDGLCGFLRKKGPWLLASIPGVLVAIQAATPQAAKGLANIIAALAAQ